MEDEGTAKAAPRRSALLQSRSQATRSKLIRAALRLWDERGFESFDQITAEDIARAAGVSKGTFYFHFARKEDVILGMSFATVERMAEEAEAAMTRSEDTIEMAGRLMASLARRVSRTPRPAVLLATSHWWRVLHATSPPSGNRSFRDAWRGVIDYGRRRGDLPDGVDVDGLAALLQTVTMDAIVTWAASTDGERVLRTMLTTRAEILLRGAAAISWSAHRAAGGPR